jgi:PAS domain S-box-containing protein
MARSAWTALVRRGAHWRALRVACIYAVFAGAWILLSDRVLAVWFTNHDELVRAGTYKGVAFVLVTSALLLWLLHATYGASERRHRDMVDGILEACLLLDHDWRYLYLNPAAEKQNRLPNQQLLGRRFTDVWPGVEHTRPFALMQRCMREHETFHEEVEFTFPDGRIAWFDLRGYPVPEGIVVLSLDVTERRAAEQALHRLNESLEQTVVARTEALQVALARAENADRIKSAFLATMSHELRTPLNSIIGFTGIILRGLAGPLSPEQARQLGMVQGSARHLLELINDVLDLSKIEAGQFTVRREKFAIAEVVERVAETLRPLAEKRGLSLSLERPPALPEITGDRRRTEQILLNLGSNAIKFTDHGAVRLRVDVPPLAEVPEGIAPGPVLRFAVVDTGIGIAPEQLETIFQPFHQVDGGISRGHDGTGLGLTICRRLASLLGGRVEARSREGLGSEFLFFLPECSPEQS